MDFFEALWRDFLSIFGEKVQLGTNSVTTLNIIVWSLFIGFMIAIGATLYNKIVLGAMVRALIERGAISESSALTAKEVGCHNPFVRFALRGGSSLRRIVRMVGDTEAEQAKCDFDAARYYIVKDSVRRAEIIYGKSEMSVVSILLTVLAFLVVALVAIIIVPDLVQLIINFMGSIAPKSNII